MSISLSETSLQELYGDDYVTGFVEDNRRYVADLLISNIAGMNWREIKHDFSSLFDESGQISQKWFNYISKNIQDMRPSLIIKRITDLSQIPRLQNEPQITYLKVFDLHRKNVYVLFVTPYILDSL
tara:strand:- start:5502 stop:5879 length:378 start_codon:yes stop_codon:yes gene_type:complete